MWSILASVLLFVSAQGEPESGPELVLLHGSLKLVTTDGEELLEPDGDLYLIVHWDPDGISEPDGEGVRANVDGGLWKVEVHPGSLVWFDCFGLPDHSPVGHLEPSTMVVEADTELHLEAVQYQRPVLFVVDGATGEPVHKVLVAHDISIPFRTCYPTELRLEHGSIPSDGPRVRLPECDPNRSDFRWFSYYVGAEGKAWKWILVDHRFGGEILVPLPEAGGLQARFTGRLPEGAAELRIDSLNNGRSVLYHRDALSAERVPVGTYAVRIVESSWPPKVLHEKVVEVKAGKMTTVSIEPSELSVSFDRTGKVPLPVEASGRILFGEEYDPDSIQLRFLGTGPDGELARWSYGDPIRMERIPGSTNEVIWHHTGLIPGRHRVAINASRRDMKGRSVTWERELEFDGKQATLLEIGEPAPRWLELTFRDARTGALIPSSPGIEGSFREVKEWTWPSCKVLLESMEQRLALDVAEVGYIPKHLEVDLQAEETQLEVRMEPAAVLEVRLLDQGRPIMLQREHWDGWETLVPESVIRLEAENKEAQILSWRSIFYSSSALRVGADRTGKYLVHIHPPHGYRTPEPFPVDLEVGSTRKIDQALERLWK